MLKNLYISQESGFNLNLRTFHLFAAKVLKELNMKIAGLEIYFVGDESILQVNIDYLEHNYITDVISLEYPEVEDTGLTGEIFICIPEAERNALAYNCSRDEELCRLVIHGLLHLSGYNDTNDDLKAKMTGMENKLLGQFFSQFKSRF